MTSKEEFIKQLIQNKEIIDKEVNDYFSPDIFIEELMLYGSDGGKRVRASLYLESKKMFSHNLTSLDYRFALAIEFIHAYSLIHDDLPPMDNDDYRRGRESLHKKFGEDLGILAGDALLNEAAIILMSVCMADNSFIKASKYLLERSSKSGMINGQILDLRHPESYDLEYILEVYARKTSDLFRASCVGAALSAGICGEDLENIENYAYNLGLSFQIQDDLLEENYEDELNILNVLSRSDAISLLKELNFKAKKAISRFDENEFLTYIVDYLSARTY